MRVRTVAEIVMAVGPPLVQYFPPPMGKEITEPLPDARQELQRTGLLGSVSMRPVAWNLFATGTAVTTTAEPGLRRCTVGGASLAMSTTTIRPSSLLMNRFCPAKPYTIPRMVTDRASSPGCAGRPSSVL